MTRFGLNKNIQFVTQVKKNEQTCCTCFIPFVKILLGRVSDHWRHHLGVSQYLGTTWSHKIFNIFGMIDYREVVKGIRIKNLIRLLNSRQGILSEIIKSSISHSLLNIKTLTPIRKSIDDSIEILRKKWIDLLTDASIITDPDIPTLFGNEYVGNVIGQKFKKQKLAKQLKNDQIGEIIENDPNHPILKKLLPQFTLLLNDPNFKSRIPTSPAQIKYDKFPFNGKILLWSKLTSKMIRESNSAPTNIPPPKITTGQNSESCLRLGKIINSLTNSKLKSIVLRCLHGDVYSKE